MRRGKRNGGSSRFEKIDEESEVSKGSEERDELIDALLEAVFFVLYLRT